VTTVEVLFGLLGLTVVGSALLVSTSSNLVHSALWLVVSLGGLAGCYLLLSAEFVAWVQVLIYMGAVVVLLLFALMLTRAPTGTVPGLNGPNRAVAAVVASATGAVLLVTFVAGFHGERLRVRHSDIGSASSVGGALFSSWVLPFEFLSVVLLAALVGAIVLSGRKGSEGPR
jgi:NADH-quinone oxidoreductase subunit J